MVKEELSAVTEPLLSWYSAHQRDLPWRRDKEPYHVWVSEIMLQQTRVEAVRQKYIDFMQVLPSVKALAACGDDLLMKLWEGLGYYSRARNLKRAAQVIMEEHGGVFPREYDAVRALPGIGDYTAGAICSICYGMPTPAVDGNVIRVMARFLCLEEDLTEQNKKRELSALLREIYPAGRCGEMTQALMELGATVCVPKGEPGCEACPLRERCRSRSGAWKRLPVRPEKKARKQENRTVLLLSCDGRIAVEKRPAAGLLAGLWQFPNVSGKLTETEAWQLAEKLGCRPQRLLSSLQRQHVFTHIQWDMTGYRIECGEMPENFRWAMADEVEREISLPTAFRQFLDTELL